MAVYPHNGKIFLLGEKIGSSYISAVAASSWPCWVAWLRHRHQHKRRLQFVLNMKLLSIKLTDVLILSFMTTTVKPLARAGAVVRGKFELKPTSSGCCTACETAWPHLALHSLNAANSSLPFLCEWIRWERKVPSKRCILQFFKLHSPWLLQSEACCA